METVLSVAEVSDHTCSIVQAGTTIGGYGHSDPNWTTPTATTANVACHYSPGGVREMVDARNQGTTIQHHTLWMKYADAPSTLLTPGSNVSHRVTTIKTTGGTSIDAGPFDITDITDMAGIHQMLRLTLKRIA